MAGHHLFIQGTPKAFSPQCARHFALIESLTMGPLFGLLVVHYVSTFCQYPERSARGFPQILQELKGKAAGQDAWLAMLRSSSSGVEGVVYPAGALAAQLFLLPLWLILCSGTPQLAHATLLHANRILQDKYAVIGQGAPPFAGERARECARDAEFHASHLSEPTDYAAAMVILLILYCILL
ncbi:unnamed protein product [Phytomonas sp. Hart1]|nr:unnamed protein product [Phytomonas sp. Hart1]|eukprot:CCW71709.1 unnamed protein product [Phytomonas sp. isolate Hart1]